MGQEILAPIAGKILQVFVSVGQTVSEDDQVVTMEAMKMENPILSPYEGVVKEIRVKVADEVKADQLLMIID